MAYVPSREACKRLGIHENTLRKWANDGGIEHIRTGSGQRRYDVDAFPRGLVSSAVVCYCRVSSTKQKDDLARQVAFMQERFPDDPGSRFARPGEVIQDCGCGLEFKRRGLRSLLERAMRGDKLRIVVAHRDRPRIGVRGKLCRFGFDPVCFVIARNGGGVVVLDDAKASPDQELVDDLLSIAHVFSCRRNGRRNYKGEKNSLSADPRTESVVQELDRLRALRLQPDGGVSAPAGHKSQLEGH